MENKHLTVGLCLVAAILFIFCPSKEKHCEHLANEIHSKCTKFIQQAMVDPPIITIYGDNALLPSTEDLANKLKTQVEYNHYGIFSTTSSEGETLSFGILGMVIITTEEL